MRQTKAKTKPESITRLIPEEKVMDEKRIPDEPEGGILDDILFVLQTTVSAARENPTVNNVNAVVKALNALKLAQGSRLDKKEKKSRSMISRKTIAFIESEILGLKAGNEDEK